MSRLYVYAPQPELQLYSSFGTASGSLNTEFDWRRRASLLYLHSNLNLHNSEDGGTP